MKLLFFLLKNNDDIKRILAIYRLMEKIRGGHDLSDEENGLTSADNMMNKRGRFLYSRRSFDDDQMEKSLLLSKRRFLKSKRATS